MSCNGFRPHGQYHWFQVTVVCLGLAAASIKKWVPCTNFKVLFVEETRNKSSCPRPLDFQVFPASLPAPARPWLWLGGYQGSTSFCANQNLQYLEKSRAQIWTMYDY